MKEPLSEPMIFYGPGSCPKCYTNLWVADAEITLMEVDSNGIPKSEETVNKVTAYCPNCGHKQLMVRWKGGYIPYTPTSLMLKELEARDEFNDRVKETNRIAEKHLGSNPFAIEE